MKSKNYSTIAISSILAFVLITTAATGIPTTSFENVLAQGENMTMEYLKIKLIVEQINLQHSIQKKLSKKKQED